MSGAGEDVAAAEVAPMTSTQRMTIVATGLGLFMVFLDALIVNVALPDIQSEFDTGETGLQWVVTGYSLGMAALIMTAATLADLHGRRRLYVLGLVVFTAASAVGGIAPGMAVLIVARCVQGAAAAVVTVTSLALLSAAFPDQAAKAKAIGLWSAIASVGLALGPSLGGVLVDLSWRSVFYVNVPIGIAAVLLTLRDVAESRDASDRDLDPIGQVLFIVAIGALAYAVIEGQQDSFASPEILAIFAVFAVGIVAFVVHELRSDDPMMDVRLFTHELYTLAIVTIFIAFFSVYGMLLVVTQFLQNVRDYSAIEAGAMMLPFALAVLVLSPLVGRVMAAIGPRTPILFGLVNLVVGLLVIAGGMDWAIALVPVGMILIGIGASSTINPVTAVSMTAVPPDRAGMASGIMSAQRALGSTVGYAVMGTILTVWLSANLAGDLDSVVRSDAERESIADGVIAQADPRSYAAELGPAQTTTIAVTQRGNEILDITDDVFVDGIQVALLVGAALLAIAFVVDTIRMPRGLIGAEEVEEEIEAEVASDVGEDRPTGGTERGPPTPKS